jgi:predicted nucleic acid-binding protein
VAVERLVIDASAMVDLLLGVPGARAIAARMREHEIHAPAHLDAEVLSALGRLERSRRLSSEAARTRLGRLEDAVITRHPLAPLVVSAWGRRAQLRLVDALYVELAERLGAPLLTTDRRLRAAYPGSELIESR